MSASAAVDAQRLSLMLNELRLPTVKHMWADCQLALKIDPLIGAQN
jgi:hypothetical protein